VNDAVSEEGDNEGEDGDDYDSSGFGEFVSRRDGFEGGSSDDGVDCRPTDAGEAVEGDGEEDGPGAEGVATDHHLTETG
jgi:hypothetical protein